MTPADDFRAALQALPCSEADRARLWDALEDAFGPKLRWLNPAGIGRVETPEYQIVMLALDGILRRDHECETAAVEAMLRTVGIDVCMCAEYKKHDPDFSCPVCQARAAYLAARRGE